MIKSNQIKSNQIKSNPINQIDAPASKYRSAQLSQQVNRRVSVIKLNRFIEKRSRYTK
jgi:hypothetical protein